MSERRSERARALSGLKWGECSKRLTAEQIENLNAHGRYADGNGLYVFVDWSGAKRWIWRGVISGKRSELGLGSTTLISLDEARAEAVRLRTIARADVLAARRGDRYGQIVATQPIGPRFHGCSATALYKAWASMLQRTGNPKDTSYASYGGRGILTCQPWHEFLLFAAYVAAHLGPRPSPLHSIDRINNDSHYEPGNIRWATPKEQAANRRRHHAR